jgi:hypothetical protein
MEVTMSNACGRCGKTESRPVEIEEVIAAREKQQRQLSIMERLHTYLNEDGAEHLGDFPEMVMLVKTNSGVHLKALDNLCSGGKGKKKGCTHRVAALMNEVFLDVPKAPKKKGPKKDKDSSEE